MKSIYEFKKGDLVTRVEPSKQLPSHFFQEEGVRDRSYIGDPLKFMGIINGCAYFKRINSIDRKIFGDDLLQLQLDIFSNGWDNYIDPKTLLSDDDKDTIVISKNGIKEALEKAILDENYEEAARLKKLLKNEEKKNKKN